MILGGGVFDDDSGTLVALTHNHDCLETTVRRLDTNHARNFLCRKQFSELAGSPLCGSSGAAAKAASDGKQAVDRQHKGKSEEKHKGKKGKQDRGKRGR